MANITLSSTHGATITPKLSAFGPNLTQAYDSLLLTSSANTTAFVTDFTFLNTPRYSNEPLFTFTPTALATLPTKVTSAGVSIGLSASVKECTLGARTGTLSLTLSSMALSATSLSATPISAVTVDNIHQSIAFTLTAANLPFHHHLCRHRFDKLRHQGQI